MYKIFICTPFLLILTQASLSKINSNATIPWEYPLFNQCDPRWAEDIMDTKTICSVGCLMSSTAMGIAGHGIPIKSIEGHDVDSTSKTLNQWLRENGGYDGGNNLIEGVVPEIDPTRIFWSDDDFHVNNDIPYDTVATYLEDGRVVIANVNDGGHFVLLVGYSSDGDTLFVNDPGYDRDTYSYKDDVVGYRIFDMI